MVKRIDLRKISEAVLFSAVAYFILWKGGKSLSALWVLAAVSAVIVIFELFSSKKKTGSVPALVWWSAVCFILLTALSFVFSTTKNYGFDEMLQTAALVLMFFWVIRWKEHEPVFKSRFMRVASAALIVASTVGIAVYILQPVNRFVGTFFDFRFHTDYWPNAWAEVVLLIWPMLVWVLWGSESASAHPESACSFPVLSEAGQPECGAMQLRPFDRLRATTFHRNRIRSMGDLSGVEGRNSLPQRGLSGEAGGYFLIWHQSDWLKASVTGLVLGCLFLSFSRGGFIAFSGQAVLMAVLAGIFYPDRKLWLRIAKMSAAAIFVSLIVFFGVNRIRANFYPVESLAKKATFSSDEGSSSVSERRQFWSQAVTLAAQKPLLGWGPYSFRFVQPRLQQDVLATSDHPHNVFLKYAMERGVPAAAAFALMIFASIIYGFVGLFKSRSFARLMLLAGISGVLAHNLIDFNLQFQGIAALFFISLGLAVDPVKQKKPEASYREIIEVVLALATLVLAVYEGIFLFESFVARRYEKTGDKLQALKWYELTDLALFPRDQWLARGLIEMSFGKTSRALGAVEKYIESNSEDARAWRLMGDISLFAGDLEESYKSYSKAYRFGRYNDTGVTRGFVYASFGIQKEIQKEEVDGLMLQFTEAVEKNTHFIALSKNVEDFISLTDLMMQRYPEDEKLYKKMAGRVQLSAKKERARLTARKGILW